MRSKIEPTLFVLMLGLMTSSYAWAQASRTDSFHKIHEYRLKGDTGWDYLTMDSATRRLYVTRGTHVQILDIDSGKLEGDIPDLKGVHGVALDKADNKGYISDGRDNSVVVFDLNSLKPTGKVQAGTNPDAILFDPTTKRVFAFNGRSSNATVIDSANDSVASTIDLGGKPEFAVSDGRSRIFVNLEDKSEILQIDPKEMKVLNHWSIKPCESPSGLAIDTDHELLFAACDNETMAILDGNSGKVIKTVRIGKGTDGAAFDRGLRQAYSSNGESGDITVVRESTPSSFEVIASVPTKSRARTMTIDEKTHNLITASADFEKTPEAAAGQPRQRPKMVPDSFVVLVYRK